MKRTPLAVLALFGLGLSACQQGPRPPGGENVCYHVIEKPKTPLRFVTVAENVPTLEDCVLQLEQIRLNFLRLGGSMHEITGAYGNQFIFIDRAGVSTSTSWTGVTYVMMNRSGGKLVRPGARSPVPTGP